jgi:hypothetical protein
MAQAQRPGPGHLPPELRLHPWPGPDPALTLILETGDPVQQRAAITASIQMQREILQAQMNYLNAMQGIVGRGGQP